MKLRFQVNDKSVENLIDSDDSVDYYNCKKKNLIDIETYKIKKIEKPLTSL